MSASVDAGDFDRAAAALETFDKLAGAEAGQMLEDAGPAVQARVRSAARRHRRTGKMESKVSVKSRGSGIDTVVRVHAGGRAYLVVGGTRAHTIAPVRSQALAIRPAGGLVGFAAAVQHPGTRPDPFVARGIRDARGELQGLLDDTARDLARELADRIEGRP